MTHQRPERGLHSPDPVAVIDPEDVYLGDPADLVDVAVPPRPPWMADAACIEHPELQWGADAGAGAPAPGGNGAGEGHLRWLSVPG